MPESGHDSSDLVGTFPGAASIVLMSHLGRPNGHKVDKYSLKPVVRVFFDHHQPVIKILTWTKCFC